MAAKDRLDQIVSMVCEHGFLSVSELSRLLQVSEMTIRRDLDRLADENRVLRTFGGAAAMGGVLSSAEETTSSARSESLVERVDILVATSVNPKYDGRLLESIAKKNIPIIAESLAIQNEETVVAVDNYRAGQDLGHAAGQYAREHWGGNARVLDLTYSLSNTQARSRGFAAGIREALPEAEIVLSINALSRYATAYQLTRDALEVNREINIIFAINDTTAWAAINACRDLRLDPQSLIVLPFGLEGNTLKDALLQGDYCKIALAHLPEIVGPVCVEAAIAAYNGISLPKQLITPYRIVTAESLQQLYSHEEDGWHLRPEAVHELPIPLNINVNQPRTGQRLPRRIGFVIPFSEHEWYKRLIAGMQEYAGRLKIEFEIIDAEENIKEEVDLRRRAIARVAASQIRAGEVVLIDGGPMCNYLAEVLLARQDITVITNSMTVFDILRANSNIVSILTGGAFRHSSQMLVGPTAEGALRELRGDKLFLMVAGVSLSFGLSHTNISEVTMKQAMIRSAREVILLADHTLFSQESVVQVAPLSVVTKVITEDALPASVRLELSKMGIQVILANE